MGISCVVERTHDAEEAKYILSDYRRCDAILDQLAETLARVNCAPVIPAEQGPHQEEAPGMRKREAGETRLIHGATIE